MNFNQACLYAPWKSEKFLFTCPQEYGRTSKKSPSSCHGKIEKYLFTRPETSEKILFVLGHVRSFYLGTFIIN